MTADEQDPNRTSEESSSRPRTLLGAKSATILYGLLLVAAFASLKGKPLMLAIIIVIGLAAKSYLHYWREKKGE